MPGKAFSLAAVCLFASSCAAAAQDQGGGAAQPSGAALRWYIADLKTSFPEHQMYSAATALTDANYVAVLNGLKDKAKVNGIRLPIFPAEPDANHYSSLYKNVFSYARRLGLAIYASPMSVGMKDYQGWSDHQYAAWLANYVGAFHPDFLSPFNEPGIGDDKVVAIAADVRSLVGGQTVLLGPDRQHVRSTIDDLARNPAVARSFDIVDSHNANKDTSATFENWARLVHSQSKPVWASEDPANWSVGADASLPGIEAAVKAGVQGLVIWYGKPSLIDDDGHPTAKAVEIAERLQR